MAQASSEQHTLLSIGVDEETVTVHPPIASGSAGAVGQQKRRSGYRYGAAASLCLGALLLMVVFSDHSTTVEPSSTGNLDETVLADWAGDASKCREFGAQRKAYGPLEHDPDCCGIPSQTTCADGYIKVATNKVCYKFKDGSRAYRYSCKPPVTSRVPIETSLPPPSSSKNGGNFPNVANIKEQGGINVALDTVFNANKLSIQGNFATGLDHDSCEQRGFYTIFDTQGCLESQASDPRFAAYADPKTFAQTPAVNPNPSPYGCWTNLQGPPGQFGKGGQTCLNPTLFTPYRCGGVLPCACYLEPPAGAFVPGACIGNACRPSYPNAFPAKLNTPATDCSKVDCGMLESTKPIAAAPPRAKVATRFLAPDLDPQVMSYLAQDVTNLTQLNGIEVAKNVIDRANIITIQGNWATGVPDSCEEHGFYTIFSVSHCLEAMQSDPRFVRYADLTRFRQTAYPYPYSARGCWANLKQPPGHGFTGGQVILNPDYTSRYKCGGVTPCACYVDPAALKDDHVALPGDADPVKTLGLEAPHISVLVSTPSAKPRVPIETSLPPPSSSKNGGNFPNIANIKEQGGIKVPEQVIQASNKISIQGIFATGVSHDSCEQLGFYTIFDVEGCLASQASDPRFAAYADPKTFAQTPAVNPNPSPYGCWTNLQGPPGQFGKGGQTCLNPTLFTPYRCGGVLPCACYLEPPVGAFVPGACIGNACRPSYPNAFPAKVFTPVTDCSKVACGILEAAQPIAAAPRAKVATRFLAPDLDPQVMSYLAQDVTNVSRLNGIEVAKNVIDRASIITIQGNWATGVPDSCEEHGFYTIFSVSHCLEAMQSDPRFASYADPARFMQTAYPYPYSARGCWANLKQPPGHGHLTGQVILNPDYTSRYKCGGVTPCACYVDPAALKGEHVALPGDATPVKTLGLDSFDK